MVSCKDCLSADNILACSEKDSMTQYLEWQLSSCTRAHRRYGGRPSLPLRRHGRCCRSLSPSLRPSADWNHRRLFRRPVLLLQLSETSPDLTTDHDSPDEPCAIISQTTPDVITSGCLPATASNLIVPEPRTVRF